VRHDPLTIEFFCGGATAALACMARSIGALAQGAAAAAQAGIPAAKPLRVALLVEPRAIDLIKAASARP
jgi:hypothetical protein